MTVTNKERYIETLTFGNPDKIPLMPGWPRESTLARWRGEGLPEEALKGDSVEFIIREMLGIDRGLPKEGQNFNPNTRMIPTFEEKVLEHKNGHYIVRDWMGAVTEISDQYDYTYIRNAYDFVTRKWHSFPVKTREDWERMKARYNPDDPARLPGNLTEVGMRLASYGDSVEWTISGVFWQMREWMGFENLCMAFIEEPDLVHDMAAFWGDFVAKMLEKVLPLVPVTRLRFSEDMAYKAHPMISPAMTREFIMPEYAKWMRLTRRYGVPVTAIDSDGYIEDLIPLWIESGFNACDPIEAAAGNDIVRFRERFGRKMAYIGGIDKRAIAAGGDVMRAEVMRVVPPLLREGGFIPSCDHAVPGDISLQNYIDYTRLLAELTGWL